LRLCNVRARSATVAAGALLSTSILAAAAAAQNDSGHTAQADPAPQPASGPVATKASSALRLHKVRRNVIAGRRVVVRGVLNPAGPGRLIELRVRSGRRWHTVDRNRTGRAGRFKLVWRAKHPGSRKMRVRFRGDPHLAGAERRAGRANVYRRAFASWYGPGFYGNRLGCGGRLGYGTIGVAHKTLPCGSRVTLRYRGRTVRVRVIDRGPYVGGREFDLTAATKRKLRFRGTGIVLTTR
jgi:rare lipoprotein A